MLADDEPHDHHQHPSLESLTATIFQQSRMSISPENVIQAADAANVISEFVAHEQIRSPTDLRSTLFKLYDSARTQSLDSSLASVGVVVLCASAVLHTAETVMSMVKELVKTTSK